jgi:hypothetical protein
MPGMVCFVMPSATRDRSLLRLASFSCGLIHIVPSCLLLKVPGRRLEHQPVPPVQRRYQPHRALRP